MSTPIQQNEASPESLVGQPSSAYRVWLPAETEISCWRQLQALSRLRFMDADDPSVADFQLLDLTIQAPIQDSAKTIRFILDAAPLPTVIFVDEESDLSTILDTASGIDLSQIELVNIAEIHGSLFDVRLKKLLATSRAQAAQNLAHSNTEIVLDAVMQYCNDWIVIKSLDHRFLNVSRNFCLAQGKPREELIGKNDLEIGTTPELVLGKPGTNWKGYWTLDKEVTDKGEPVVLQPLVLDEGEQWQRSESTDKVPLRDRQGEVFALLVCVSEVTFDNDSEHLKNLENPQLWEIKGNLTHSPALMELNNERKRVEALQRKSEQAYKAKNQFIAAASHDLRQPLHALGLYIGALEERVDNNSLPYIDKIKHCAGSLNELLTSLLDISRLDANVVSADYSSFSIHELLQSLYDECASVARGKSLDFSFESDGSLVYSDPILLRRVVRNLVINAINYTETGRVSITAQQLGNFVDIVVRDTGIGIPAEKHQEVFTEFMKLESDSQSIEQGLGLGLSIVQRLCLLLDIKVSLESAAGAGTSFSLLVPLGRGNAAVLDDAKRRAEMPVTSSSCAQPASLVGTGKTLLVIDDNQAVCEAVEAILRQSGYEALSAVSIDEAIDKLESSIAFPDAILVDYRLSDTMTGVDAVEAIKQKSGLSFPALIVTGDTSNACIEEITDAGFSYLHKPVDADQLLEMVFGLIHNTNSQMAQLSPGTEIQGS